MQRPAKNRTAYSPSHHHERITRHVVKEQKTVSDESPILYVDFTDVLTATQESRFRDKNDLSHDIFAVVVVIG